MKQSRKQSDPGRSLLDRIADGLLILALIAVAAAIAIACWFAYAVSQIGD
jgi:hypothetical protein